MKNIDGGYLCTKDLTKKYDLPLHSNTVYYCSEVIDGMVKIFFTRSTTLCISFEEFSKHFCLTEVKRKKNDSVRKSVGLFTFK